MKKKLIMMCLAFGLFVSALPALADEVYEVPVKLENSYEQGKASIANKALNPKARVALTDNGTQVALEFAPLEVGTLKENINRMFLVEGTKKVEAKKEATGNAPYNVKASFTTSEKKPSELTLAFWVDAMDALKGGGEGSGEQQAKLKLDWSKATLLTRGQAPSKVAPSKKGISVFVKGEAVSFTNAPINQKGSVIVPLRAIFEALGAEVKWDAKTRSAIATKDGTTLSLTVNQKTSTIEKDGQKRVVKLTAPAQIINGSIYVPLRFIGEGFGNKVGYQAQGSSATITIE